MRNVMAPVGKIRLSGKTQLTDLQKVAERNRYPYDILPYEAVEPRVADGVDAKKYVDPFCGCRLHYPESKGASLRVKPKTKG